MSYLTMSKEELQAEYCALNTHFASCKEQNLKLNMARGKPGTEQLDLVMDIFSVLPTNADYISSGIDSRNYGELSGIPEAKVLFADILGCKPSQVFVGGNASLQLMYDAISKAYTHGLKRSVRKWSEEPVVKWLSSIITFTTLYYITKHFKLLGINVCPLTAIALGLCNCSYLLCLIASLGSI